MLAKPACLHVADKLLVIPAFRQPAFSSGGNIEGLRRFQVPRMVMILRTAVDCRILLAAVLMLIPVSGLGQLAPSVCDAIYKTIEDCSSEYEDKTTAATCAFQSPNLSDGLLNNQNFESDSVHAAALDDAPSPAPESDKLGLHWRRALTEAATFLVIEQAYVVHTDFRWVVSENGIPFNHYWRDYMQSLTSWWHAGWSAGENPLYNYLGHPIQGAITSYIEINNDSRYSTLEFSNSKAYWKSRLKATIFNTVYSTQWSIGLLSEPTVEKYGSKDRAPWNANGTYPCDTNTCYSGVGKVNLVMTPVGGLGWVLAEDILDKKVAEPFEANHQNRFLINFVRSATNPIRGGANILHGNRPWYRARDGQPMTFLTEQKHLEPTNEVPQSPLPNHGTILLGYSHLGPSHCEAVPATNYIPCDPLSQASSNLSGWNTGIEKGYLRYFGLVADFSGEYGGVGQTNFLFGVRGGSWIGRFRPYANVLFGAVREHGNTSAGFMSDTTFAEDLGMGIDCRLIGRLSWRNQVDELKTGDENFKRYNVRTSSGFAVRF